MFVRREDRGGVAVLTMDRPPVNAFDVAAVRELDDAVHGALADADVRALVLAGAGRAFCAGADARALAAAETARRGDLVRDLTRHHHEIVRSLRTAPKPVVCAVGGAAAGGGFGLALAGDLRLGSPAALFKPGFLALGLPPDGGLTHSLPRAAGPAQAARILLQDARVEAEEARALGLLHRLVPAERLLEEAEAEAARLAAWPREAFAATKALLASTHDNPLTVQLAEERMAIVRAAGSAATAEALARFVAKK